MNCLYLDTERVQAAITGATQHQSGAGVRTRGAAYGAVRHVPPHGASAPRTQHVHRVVITT